MIGRGHLHGGRLLLSLLLSLVGVVQALPVQAGGAYESYFLTAVEDRLLDRLEYRQLQQRARTARDPESRRLAALLLPMLAKYRQPTHFDLKYPQAGQVRILSFLFDPTYAEDEPIAGRNIPEFLGRISQGDQLAETRGDDWRCSAAALLAGHLVVYGNYRLAFQRLGLAGAPLTYRSMHLAQDRLYNRANVDGRVGLEMKVSYQRTARGLMKVAQSGETDTAAQLIGLKATVIQDSLLPDKAARRRAIDAFWRRYPAVPLLIGAHLDLHTGVLTGTDGRSLLDNHAILLFRTRTGVWLYNSGVSQNGAQAAIRLLKAPDLENLLYQAASPVFYLTRLK